MIALGREAVLAERLRRQGLASPLTRRKDYPTLFRRLQPVSTVTNVRPGSPPSLVHRTRFDGDAEARSLRSRRALVKGRFLGTLIGYVAAEDLALYASAFRRPLPRPNDTQRRVLEVVSTLGPLTPRQIKEETGLLNRDIMPALHRLQVAFAVHEDQVDDDWERGWSAFESEWPDAELDGRAPEDDRAAVLERFLEGHVFATLAQLRDWSRLPLKDLRRVTGDLVERGALHAAALADGSEGFVRAADRKLPDRPPAPSAFLLHTQDPLVRSHAGELARRFGRGALAYLLVDGEFRGAARGRWKMGPHDVEDVVLDLPAAELGRRRDEILGAVAKVYPEPRHRILRYAGAPL